VSFLSKHSTRNPGVALIDEIGIAIGVKEGNIQDIWSESDRRCRRAGRTATRGSTGTTGRIRRAAVASDGIMGTEENLAELVGLWGRAGKPALVR